MFTVNFSKEDIFAFLGVFFDKIGIEDLSVWGIR